MKVISDKGHIVTILITLVFVSLSFATGLFSGLERFLEDRLFTNKEISEEIIIVAIDDASIKEFGQWPWPREVFAQFLNALNDAPPKAVGFDVIFSEPSRIGERDDGALETALRSSTYPVIFPVEATGNTPLFPLERFNEHVTLGHINITIDPDGVARTFPAEVNELQSFAQKILTATDIPIPAVTTLTDRNRIVYAGPPNSYRTIPFTRFLSDENLRSEVANSILLVGATAIDLHDNKPTPMSRGIAMSGVEIHANIVNMLIQEYQLLPLPALFHYIWFLLATLIPLGIIRFAKSLKVIVGLNILIGFIYLVVQVALFQTGTAVNIVHIHLAWILSAVSLTGYQYFSIDKDRAEMKKMFGKYVSSKVLDEILEHPERVTLGGEEREITILFSDIRGFTTLSESTTPTQLVHVINRYFTAMTEEILINDGVVDKYIGDAIMAFWGAPLADEAQADNALKAALGMKERLVEFNKELQKEIGLEIKIGVGLYTGPAVVGNMGSNERFDYTAMGDSVNTSARLEGITKVYGVGTIIGESTFLSIQEPEKYIIRELDQIIVKGKKEPRRIFEPFFKTEVSQVQQKQLDSFTLGRDAYYAGNWTKAIMHFEQTLALGPDGPSEELLRRTKELKTNPPKEWNGVYTFTSK